MFKAGPADLAVLGGPAAFVEPLHVGRPNIPDPSLLLGDYADILSRRWLTNSGIYEQRFERELQDVLGARHCIAVANCTLGLILAARATNLHGEVILPSFTFPGTAHALSWLGIQPVFCDIDPHTYQVDCDQVEALITPRTTGIVGVHLFGRLCDVDRLEDIAGRHGLRLILDGAQAVGCGSETRTVGSGGDATVFSFHATKVVNASEGGVIATDDDDLAAELRLLRNFGFAGMDRSESVGINAKMSEVAAATGLRSLDQLGEFIAINESNFRFYRAALSDVPGLSLSAPDEHVSNFHYVVAEVDEVHAGFSRDHLLAVLHAENVLARRYFHPGCHRLPPYQNAARRQAPLPSTEAVADRVLVLPTGSAVGRSEIGKIASIIEVVSKSADEVAHHLRADPR